MKNENGFGRKLRYGSTSLGITALVIALVLLVNVAVYVTSSNPHAAEFYGIIAIVAVINVAKSCKVGNKKIINDCGCRS